MSRDFFTCSGYGLCIAKLEINSVERFEKLLELSPKFQGMIHNYFEENSISNPNIDDYLEFNNPCEDHGFASIIKNALEEITGICFLDCEDYEGNGYLLYEPKYPWSMSENESKLTRKKLDEIYTAYISIITDTELEIDYVTVEDC